MATSEADLKALMIGSLDGDAAAHGLLLRALVPLLHAFYRRRLANAADADDLIQDTLIAVHTRRESFDRSRPFTAWLFAIARYRMIDHFRRRRQTVAIEDVESILVTEGFEDATNARMDVDSLLMTLTRKQARAIRDTHVEGKSVAEAAADAGIGESDVKVSVHRGLKALGARIKGSSR
jgi:RNA polymerase sigma-70 factor (ECF subfamily)